MSQIKYTIGGGYVLDSGGSNVEHHGLNGACMGRCLIVALIGNPILSTDPAHGAPDVLGFADCHDLAVIDGDYDRRRRQAHGHEFSSGVLDCAGKRLAVGFRVHEGLMRAVGEMFNYERVRRFGS